MVLPDEDGPDNPIITGLVDMPYQIVPLNNLSMVMEHPCRSRWSLTISGRSAHYVKNEPLSSSLRKHNIIVSNGLTMF